jgi:hypothetical protein
MLAVALVVIAIAFGMKSSRRIPPPVVVPPATVPPKLRADATPEVRSDPSDVVLTFGEEGTGDGQFKDASEIAVDASGRIFVSDGTTRVQVFDEKGKFVKTFLVPQQTRWYQKVRGGPDKLVVDRAGNLHVLIAGVVLKIDVDKGEILGAVQGSDYIHDVALMPDDGLVMVSQKGADDELVRVDARGRPVGRTHRYSTSVLEASLEVRALRVAADGLGNIFSVYALDDAFGEFNYDSEDLAILKFTPAGKFVTRMGSQGNEAGQYSTPGEIALDRRGRLYLCESSKGVHVYANDGRFLETVPVPFWVRGIALDNSDNIYVVGANNVAKLKARA